MNDIETLKHLYEEMYRGMIHKDRQLLDEVLSSDFVLIHMTGMHQSKEEYIKAIENGTLNYFTAYTEDCSVKVSIDQAEIIGKSQVEAAVFGGGRARWPLQQDIECKKINGQWQFVKSQASTY